MRRILLTAMLVIGLVPAGATAAHADEVVHGFVLANQPHTANYIVNHAFKHNSVGGPIEITRAAVGRYQVRFAGMGTTGGAAHVQNYGSLSAAACTVAGWGTSFLAPSDLLVNVRCFNAAGALTDSRFIADFTNRTGAAGRFAYLWADKPNNVIPYQPSAAYSYDSTGVAPLIDPDGVGVYRVYINAWLELDGTDQVDAGHFQVTAYGTSAVRCTAGYDDDVPGPTQLSVLCRDSDGDLVNSRFVLSYSLEASHLGVTDPHGNAIVSDDLVHNWWSSTGSEPTVFSPNTGVYQVRFPGLGASGGFAIVSSVTSRGYCYAHSWLGAMGGDQVVNVRCHDMLTGWATDGAFHVAFMTWGRTVSQPRDLYTSARCSIAVTVTVMASSSTS